MSKDDDVQPGTGGRPWGCFYFKEDHDRAAAYVREHAPEIFEWLKNDDDGLIEDVEKLQKLFRTVPEVLPRALLIDQTAVKNTLLVQAKPLSEYDKWLIKDMERRSDERQARNNSSAGPNRKDH